ncbi:MAG TPA: hypothetical protein VJ873_14345, partial [bacterium]|nr:hypothetical protein [bacterium]
GSGQTQRWNLDSGLTEGDDLPTTTAGSYSMNYSMSPSGGADMEEVEILSAGVCATYTPTPTNTFQYTATKTPTNTATMTATSTPTNTPTSTTTLTYTITDTPTNTLSPTNTPTLTNTPGWLTCSASVSMPVTEPFAVALDGQGNIYVTDDQDNQVNVFNAAGTTLTNQWGIQGPYNGQFNSPGGIGVDGSGLVYVADSGNNRIEVFNGSGQYVSQWGSEGSGNGRLEYPVGLAAGPSSIYVADVDNSRIEVFDKQGNYLNQWVTVSSGGATFVNPWGVALDAGGNVYVTDNATGMLDIFTYNGTPVTQLNVTQGTALQTAELLAVDTVTGVVYVTDGYGSVAFFDGNRNVLGSTQGLTITGAGISFIGSEGVAASNGTWCLADDGNGEVYKSSGCGLATPTPLTNTATPTNTPTNTYTFTLSPTPFSMVWNVANGTSPFSPRSGLAALSYKNQMWVLAGQDANGPKNDVWYSSDGANWKLTDGSAVTYTPTVTYTITNTPTGTLTPTLTPTFTPVPVLFGARYGHGALVYNKKMWVIGGTTNASAG